MPTFIKTGFWEKSYKSFKGWLNLEDLILSVVSSINFPTATLPNTSTIDIASNKNRLTSASSTRTFTISYSGDDVTIEVILNTSSATYTFPSNSLCVSEGIASGDNTLSLSGVTGDRYIIGIKSINNTYYVVGKNFGQ